MNFGYWNWTSCLFSFIDKKSDKSSSSKTDETPSTSKEKFVVKLLPSKSDEETASNSSADFEPVQRYNTPRRQLRASTEKRRTRSSAKILDEIVEDSCECDVTDSTVNEKAGDELVDPMESSVTLPDPPSPSLLDDLEEKVSNNSDAVSEKDIMFSGLLSFSKHVYKTMYFLTNQSFIFLNNLGKLRKR